MPKQAQAIGIGAFESIEGIEEFWVFFGTGVNRRVFAIHEIVSSLGSNRSGALPMFHAFTGCDTVSSFLCKGKKSAWQTWIHFDDVTTDPWLPVLDNTGDAKHNQPFHI